MSSYAAKAASLGADVVLDGVSGSTWTDGTSNNLDATIVGGTSTTGPGDGLPTAVSFDGVDDYASIADNVAFQWNASTEFSFGCWVKRAAENDGVYRSWLGAGQTIAASATSFRAYGGGSDGDYEVNGSWMLVGRWGGANLPLSTWTFVVFTWDLTTLRLYEGNLTTSPTLFDTNSSVNTKTKTDGGLYIGAELYNNAVRRHYASDIAGPFTKLGTVLSLTQIQDLYDETFVASSVNVAANNLTVVSDVDIPTIELGPVTPTNFVFTAHSNLVQLDGSWDAVPGADSYNVEVDEETAPSTWAPFSHFNTINTSFQLTPVDGVTSNTKYRSRVQSASA